MAKRTSKDNDFRITELQPDDEVTGSCLLVEVDEQVIMIDYGMLQNSHFDVTKAYDIAKEKKKVPIDKLTAVIITHSHADHVGNLGILSRSDIDFNGKIYATELCAALTREILYDSAHIMNSEVERYNNNNKDKRKLSALYTKDEVDALMNMIRCYGYEEKVYLTEHLYFEFLPSGHLPASAMIYLVYEKPDGRKKTLLCTGDFYYGDNARPFTKSVLKKCLKANTVVVESTYGNRKHDYSNPIDFIEDIIMKECVNKNRILFIPVFAQHRSTVLCYYLYQIFRRNEEIRKKNIPVYFCSKLLSTCHDLLSKEAYKEFYDDEWKDLDHIFKNSGFTFVKQGLDVQKLLNNNLKIIIASSGMMSGGFSTMIAKSYVPNTKVSILATGFQGEDTIGRLLMDNEHKKIVIEGEAKTVRCKHLGIIPNMSCHADVDGIISFVKSLNQNVLKKILIHHGGKEERENLQKELENVFKDRVEVKILNQYDKVKF